ncbi:ABC-2 family transporter protein [Candidatus Woesearchaeota archaeon]|nr:ABC-2 family transporter protein [Candidatus Woesearchaeota archaeon]
MNINAHKGMAIMGIKVATRYRWEVVAAVAATPLALVIYYYLWKSIYAHTGQALIRGFTFEELVSYYVLSMIVGFFTWSEMDKWIEHDIIKGDLVKNLIKPFGYISSCFSFELGLNAYNILTQMIPVFIIGFLFFKLPIAPLMVFLGFALSLFFAFLLYFGLAFLLGLAAFWMKKITGLRRARRIIVAFFGGSFIPLAFFPPWLQEISAYLPFQYIRSVPILLYQQRIAIGHSLLAQAAWVVVLYTLIYIVSRKAMRKAAVVGL